MASNAKTQADKKPGRLKDLADSSGDLLNLDPRKIVIDPNFNVRRRTPELASHIEYLSQSITQEGVKNPVTVRYKDGKVILVDGHCRHEATMLAIKNGAEIKTIPAVQESRHTSEMDRTLSLITKNSGKPLTPLEQAVVFKRLYDMGWSPTQIKERSGLSISHVSNLLNLSAAPEELKQLVETGKISPTMANNAVRDHKDDALAVVQLAIETAQIEGKDRATPKHITRAFETARPIKGTTAKHRTTGLKKYSTAQVNRMLAFIEWSRDNSSDAKARKDAKILADDLGL